MSKESAMAFAATAAPAEAPKPETAIPPNGAPVAEAPKDDLVSSRIAQIARKEAKYREEQEALKRQMEEFQVNKSKFDPFYERYKQFEEMRTKDPVAAIKLLGFSDTDYINFVAAQEDKSTPEERAAKIAEEKIAQFKAEQETKEKESEAKRNEESIGQFKKNIGIAVKTDPERFELCNYYGEAAEALIFKTVQEAFQEDLKTNPLAEPMTAEKAAELVESYYEEFHQNANKLKKFNKQPEEAVGEPVAKKEEALKAQVNPMPGKTLTNRVSPTAASVSGVKPPETREEKRQRLMKALAEGRRP